MWNFSSDSELNRKRWGRGEQASRRTQPCCEMAYGKAIRGRGSFMRSTHGAVRAKELRPLIIPEVHLRASSLVRL